MNRCRPLDADDEENGNKQAQHFLTDVYTKLSREQSSGRLDEKVPYLFANSNLGIVFVLLYRSKL